MPRRWRGAITLENVQTGDGRVFAPGAIEWADLPLPLSWMSEGGSLHVDLATTAPQIGIIETITREGDEIIGEGIIDDTVPEGADVCRRMDEGVAPLGNRFPVSIDPDNWEVEVILTEVGEAEDILILASASGHGPLPDRAALVAALGIRAAAGDPDPGEDGGEGGELLFQDSVDEILERYTRLRIRGATLCDIAAFDGAFVELVADGAETAAPPAEEPSAATTAALSVPARPPREWFDEPYPQAGDERLVEQPDGSWAVPLTITDDGRVFGHIARAGQPHRGYAPQRYVPPPTSARRYAEFHVGEVHCADGSVVATGPMVVGCDHAPLSMTLGQARDHYANSGLGWADGRMTDGPFGPWFAGALRPTVTEEELRVLRALAPSGDWRSDGRDLELVAVLSVNAPGFPIAREAMAASALTVAAALDAPAMEIGADGPTALVAAGLVHRCADCAERARLECAKDDAMAAMAAGIDGMRALLAAIDRRTRHLEPVAASALRARVHGDTEA